jgi:hypothetical protein
VSILRRIGPAPLLLGLSPVMAEFLLGDLTFRQLGLLVVLLPQYGGGALLIREVTRRTGRGWPTMLLLALAYALIEEGWTTMSLFNPNYAGQRLLDYGFVPALGTSPVWAVFVLTIHVVWSIATPILIAEGVAGGRRTEPWLGRVGLRVVAVLYVLGCVITIFGTFPRSDFHATDAQLVAIGMLMALVVVVAFGAFRGRRPPAAGTAPPAWLAGLAALALATAFQLARHVLAGAAPAWATTLAMLACGAIAVALFTIWSRGRGWGGVHYLAIAAGTALTYTGVGLSAFLQGRTNLGTPATPVDVAGQVVLALIVLALVAWGLARTRAAAAA